MNTTRSRPSRERPTTSPARRPRRWKRKLIIAIATLVALGAFANGPGFRLVGSKLLAKQLAAAGLEGEFELSGTILGGIRIDNARWEGSRGIAELKVGELAIDYDMGDLLARRWIEAIGPVRLGNVEATFVAQAESEKKPLPEKLTALGKAWPLIAEIARQEFDIDEISLTFLDAERQSKFALENMTLALDGGIGEWSAGAIQLPNGERHRDLRAGLAVNGDDEILLTGLQLADDLGVAQLGVSPPPPGGNFPRAQGQLDLCGGRLAITPQPDSIEHVHVELESGEVDLERLASLIGTEFPVAGRITRMATGLNGRIGDLDSITISGSVGGRGLAAFGLEHGRAEADFSIAGETLQLEPFTVAVAGNEVRGNGAISFADRQPGSPPDSRFDLALDAPSVESIASAFEVPLAGSLGGTVGFGFTKGSIDQLSCELRSPGLSYGGAGLDDIELIATGEGPQSDFEFSAGLGEERANTIKGSGTVDFAELGYTGGADLALGDLSQVAEAAREFGADLQLAGSAKVKWQGGGNLDAREHSGEAVLSEASVTLRDGDAIRGGLVFGYSPDSLSATGCQLELGRLSLLGEGSLANDTLELKGVRLRTVGETESTELGQIDATVPLDFESLSDTETFFDQPGDVSVRVRINELALSDIAALVQKDFGVLGTIDAKLDLDGSLSALAGGGEVKLSGLKPSGESKLAAAEAGLRLDVADGRLAVDGEFLQPDLPPITLSGSAPLRPEKLANDPASLSRQRFDLRAHCPTTQLAWLRRYVPGMTHADGTFAADLRLSGTADEPQLSGQITGEASLLKFRRESIPTATDVKLDIKLEGDRVEIEACRGTLAGGFIEVEGGATLASLTDPELSLKLGATDALLHRDDNISARANIDLSLQGPLSAAALSGKVGIVYGHFYREIEILPIGLPRLQRAPSVPRAPALETRRNFGIAAKPVADWKLDLQIETEHPIQFRGNWAQGTVEADLAITGTGASPIPSGTVTLGEESVATLPFSNLRVDNGTLQFDASTGFDPRIAFNGHSRLGSYSISLRVSGRLSDPQTSITSDPPLPEQDAISLLATGRRTADLASTEVIAGAAATLLLDKVLRRTGLKKPDAQLSSLSDRLDFKAGQIDPKSGNRAVSAELELSDRVFLIGDVDSDGDYRGIVKFLVRVR